MAKSKLTDKLIIAMPIIVAVIALCVLLFIGGKKTEGFTSVLEQKDNLIATSFTTSNENLPQDSNNLQQVGFDNPNLMDSNRIINDSTGQERKCKDGYYFKQDINENNLFYWACGDKCEGGQNLTDAYCKCACINQRQETNTFNPSLKSKVVLNDTYVIKQIHIKGVTGNFRIGVKNSARNKISYVSSLELNHENISEIFADNSPRFVMMTMFNSTDDFKDLNPKDIYGNDLVGDEIIVFTDISVGDASNIFIMGHLENEHYHDKHDTQKLERNTNGNVGYDIIQTYKTELEKISNETRKPYGITKMIIPVNEKTNIKVLFQNNYSNNSFTFEGPLPNREFIVTPEYNTIFFHHTLLADKIVVIDTATGDVITSGVEIYGYTPSIDDVNRFKLEYNLTDVRGSINPDDVCPSLDQYMNDQLNSEIVIDAMEYQDKINMEKMKLSNNKASMLTLLEQEEEIHKLERMINKIDDLHQQRKHTTNALNALHLRRQMDEVLKLRDVLDNRIALREQNTINIPVDINKVKVVDKDDEQTSENLDVFADIPLSKEEDMKI